MPGYRLVARPATLRYLYDGSLEGLYCCIHDAIRRQELPAAILPEAEAPPSLFPDRRVAAHPQTAARVRNSIRDKISLRALELVETVYYSCLQEKELCILRFLLLAYAEGARTPRMLGHPQVDMLLKAERALWGEQHKLLGFVRFADYGGMLAGVITPKNFVLPFMVDHFSNRYSCESFLLYDKTHQAALVYENRQSAIVRMENLQLAPPTQEEQAYRALWKQFYHTVAIEARKNHKCRMGHMPKRYWENMVEMQEEGDEKGLLKPKGRHEIIWPTAPAAALSGNASNSVPADRPLRESPPS